MTTLLPTKVPGVFVDAKGGQEPAFVRDVVRGEIVYWHQSGYGCLSASQVTIGEPA